MQKSNLKFSDWPIDCNVVVKSPNRFPFSFKVVNFFNGANVRSEMLEI